MREGLRGHQPALAEQSQDVVARFGGETGADHVMKNGLPKNTETRWLRVCG
jgi:hypothetical protein